MAIPIHYARTSDGLNIAYGDIGEGEPLIYLPALPWSNFSVCLSSPYTARHPLDLATFSRLLIYDARGCGLSDHDAPDLTLEGFARDIDAIADAAGCDRFGLYGSADGSRVMVHYAATRPERVTRLILWVPSASSERLRSDPVLRAVRPLLDRDWETYLCTMSYAVVGGWDAERAPYAAAFADMMRAGIRPGEFPAMVAAMRLHDVTAALASVKAPTIVLTREQAALYGMDIVREVAAGIPGAKLVVSPGSWLMPCTDDEITYEIAKFMGAAFERSMPREGSGVPPPMPVSNGHNDGPRLSKREAEVLSLIARGRTNAEIAGELVIAPTTASRHVHNILTKLGMSRRAEAAAYAALEGLVPAGAAAQP